MGTSCKSGYFYSLGTFAALNREIEQQKKMLKKSGATPEAIKKADDDFWKKSEKHAYGKASD